MIAGAGFQNSNLVDTVGVKRPAELVGKKLLILWGGEDISPSIYKQKSGRAYAPDTPSSRDLLEIDLVSHAIDMGIPILGICRGAQLLCALGGGTLYQHVENHVVGHHKLIFQGKEYTTNSCHHQMMRPTADMEVLAHSPVLSPRKWVEDADPVHDDSPEPEIVYFPKMKAIGVQGHPEWLSESHDLVKITKQLVKEKLNVTLGR